MSGRPTPPCGLWRDLFTPDALTRKLDAGRIGEVAAVAGASPGEG